MTRPARVVPRLLLGVVVATLVGVGAPRRPAHLVLVVADTLRRDHVSAYGGTIATPNVDRLAASGQALPNVVASFHQTSMSMGALFTGRTPSIESGSARSPLHWNGRTWCGLARLTPPGAEERCVPSTLPTLAEAMRRAGYRTIGVASNEFLFRPAGFDRGFDDWSEVGLLPSDVPRADPLARQRARTAADVNRAVRAALDRDRGGAGLFLYVHYMDAHDWDLHGSYADAVRALDAGIGGLLDELDRRGVLRDAVVVFTADHGEALGERHALPSPRGHVGNPSFEPVLRIPLIVAPPVVADPDRLRRSEDVYRLLHRLAGAPVPAARDLEPDELYLSEVGHQTYRRERWKSMRQRATGAFSLFDLETDPGETRDVAAWHPEMSARHARRMAALARALAAPGERPTSLSPTDAARLRALGYLP